MATLRVNDERQETELRIDGNFVVSYRVLDLPDADRRLVCNIIDAAVEYGRNAMAEEIRGLLGVHK